MIAIVDETVAYVRDGELVIAGPHGPRAHAGPIEELAAVGDELWMVTAGDDHSELRRLDRTGEQIGGALALPPEGRLIAAARGAAATWNGARPLLVTVQAGELAAQPLKPCDLAIATEGARVATITGCAVELARGSSARVGQLPAGHRAVDGAALLDAGVLCVIAVRGRGNAVAIVIGNDGATRLRLALVGARRTRIAPARGVLAVQTEDARISVVDLRFGKVVQEIEHASAIVDFAIDRAGYMLALLDADGELVVLADRDRRLVPIDGRDLCPAGSTAEGRCGSIDGRDLCPAGSTAEGRCGSIDEDATTIMTPTAEPYVLEPAASEPTLAAAPVLGDVDDDHGPALAGIPAALIVRRHHPDARIDAEVLLSAWRDELRARTRLAIARAWDRGIIAFAREDQLPGQSEVAALASPSGGRAHAELIAANQLVTTAVASRAACERATTLDPLAELARELALTALDRDVLIAIAAPQLWADVARLYALLGNRSGRARCDEALLAEVLADRATEHDIARACAPDGALATHGILDPAANGLAVVPCVVHRLRGAETERDPDAAVSIHDDHEPLDALVLSRDIRVQLRAVFDDPTAPFRLAVRGRPGSGRRTLLARLAASAGLKLALVDAGAYLHGSATRLDTLRGVLQRAHLCGWLPCLDGLAGAPDDPVLRGQLTTVLRDHRGPLCFRVASDATPLAGRVIDLPQLGHRERTTLWRHALASAGRADDADELATRWAVGAGTIHRAVERAGEAGDLGDAIRELLDDRLATLATRVRRLARWEDVVLPPELLDSMSELIARVRHRDQVLERWGLARVATTSRGVVALFQGAPGTGKTLVAGAIARELGLDLFRVDLARVVSKWLGETERNLAAVFDAAEDGNAILLFDEADSLFARRTEVRTSVDRYANLEVNYLLQRLDTFTGVAILTSNFGTAIDDAFKRRMSFRLSFPFPDEEMREQLWRVHLPPTVPRAGAFDLAALATRHSIAGGHIRNAALRAAFLAAGEGSPLRQAHLERAIHLEYRELGRLADAGK